MRGLRDWSIFCFCIGSSQFRVNKRTIYLRIVIAKHEYKSMKLSIFYTCMVGLNRGHWYQTTRRIQPYLSSRIWVRIRKLFMLIKMPSSRNETYPNKASNHTYIVCLVSFGTGIPHSTDAREIEKSLNPPLIQPSTYSCVLISKITKKQGHPKTMKITTCDLKDCQLMKRQGLYY